MKISFDTVIERDMDMLFMHAFAEDKDQYEYVVVLAEKLNKYSRYDISPVDFGKSAGLRITVPALDAEGF